MKLLDIETAVILLKLFLNESADAPVEVFGAIGQNLLGERAHAAAVFPEPTAPTMAVPVKRPRSGMTSQRGASEGLCLRGGCTSPTTRGSSVLFRRTG